MKFIEDESQGYWSPVLSDDDLTWFKREQDEREVNLLITDGFVKEAMELEKELE